MFKKLSLATTVCALLTLTASMGAAVPAPLQQLKNSGWQCWCCKQTADGLYADYAYAVKSTPLVVFHAETFEESYYFWIETGFANAKFLNIKESNDAFSDVSIEKKGDFLRVCTDSKEFFGKEAQKWLDTIGQHSSNPLFIGVIKQAFACIDSLEKTTKGANHA